MFHVLDYSLAGSDFVNDTIYVGYRGFMWGTISLASYLTIEPFLLNINEMAGVRRRQQRLRGPACSGPNVIKCDAEEPVRVK
jgi:hypothetical protein